MISSHARLELAVRVELASWSGWQLAQFDAPLESPARSRGGWWAAIATGSGPHTNTAATARGAAASVASSGKILRTTTS
ncbi:MAG: hypothetical protein FJ298_08610 [Planctomycetes bacterium]|nr:hypothetical protein [Planctomycetota bacterium]